METIYAIPEVATYLKMSKSKVYDLVKKGKIPFIRIGKNVRIRQSDLMKWLDEQTRP
jgi:putative molybdopterin biosynthesis protein